MEICKKLKGTFIFYVIQKTNSIINTNMVEYQEYLNRRNVKADENQKIQHLESDVANIKNDLSEIKSLLRSLVNESR